MVFTELKLELKDTGLPCIALAQFPGLSLDFSQVTYNLFWVKQYLCSHTNTWYRWCFVWLVLVRLVKGLPRVTQVRCFDICQRLRKH